MRLTRFMPAIPATLSLIALQNPALATGTPEASPTFKGITGGALLGAEVVLLTEAVIGVEPTWLYVVGGLAGAGAGGVGGYFLEKSGDPQPSMFLLAAGMALAIPTMVVVLNAQAYKPPASATEDQGPADEPVAEPPQPQASRARSGVVLTRTHSSPPALVDLDTAGWLSLSIPAIEVRDLYTREQVAQLGVKQETELRVPVLNLHF